MARAALACWVLFALIAAWMVSGGSQAFDAAGMRLWRDAAGAPLGPAWLVPLLRFVTETGTALIRNAFALIVVLYVLLRKRRDLAAMVAVAAFPAGMINSAMKELFGRARPYLVPHLVGAGGLAFPSGHSFDSAAVYVAVALALGAVSGRARPLLALALTWSATVAFSRVWLGVHWPTDALAGWLGGAGWALAVFAAGTRAANRISAAAPATSP